MTKPNENQTKADAMLAAAKQAEADKAAFEAARVTMFDTVRKHGAEAATGAQSLTKVAFLFNAAVRAGVMTAGDATKVFVAYGEAFNAAIAAGEVMIGNVAYRVTTNALKDLSSEKTKSGASLLRTFAAPAVVAQGLNFFVEVQEVAAALPVEGRAQASVWNCLVLANRKLIAACDADLMSDADIAAGKFAVTRDMIREWIAAPAKEEAAEKTFDERLARLVLDMAKLVKKGEEPRLRAIYDQLDQLAAARKLTKAESANAVANVVTLEKKAA